MKLGVVGSRTFNDYHYLIKKLDEFIAGYRELYNVSDFEIVSGGASGADSWAEQYADDFKIPKQIFPANWRPNGVLDRSAGFKRNKQIVDYSDVILAFWDGESKGTKNSIDLAVKQGKPTYIYTDWNINGTTIPKFSNPIKTPNI